MAEYKWTSKKEQKMITHAGSPVAIAILLGMMTLESSGQAAAVANGGFESGNLSGWTLSNGVSFDAVCADGNSIGAATCIAQSGTYAMSFGHGFGTTALSQTLATTPGESYTLSFYVANDNPNGLGTETFRVLWDGSSVASLSSPQAAFPFALMSFNVTASASATVLRFEARHDPSQWFLDDVSVEAVPEPGSVTMVAMGFIAAVLGRRLHIVRKIKANRRYEKI